MSALQVCVLSSEIMPYAKTGGLADVAGALIRSLRLVGHDVRGFMPLYPVVRSQHADLQPISGLTQIPLSIGTTDYSFSVCGAKFVGTDIPMYFIDCPALYDRPSLYTNDPDEHRRFLLFTRATLESCRRMGWGPDIFHCNDWHTAFLPLYLKTLYASESHFGKSKSVLTIHNIAYQGVMASSAVADLNLGLAWTQLDQADLARGVVNSLGNGIKYADCVTTVSPTYAREICDAPLGMGLETALRARTDRVVGILNGVDYLEWDPRHDPYLGVHFDEKDLLGKASNKQLLLTATQLNLAPGVPLIAMVTRLTEQKGIDLLFDALPALLQSRDFGLVVLGTGDAPYETFFAELARRFEGRVAYLAGQDEPMAHLIEAGSDMLLMPSRYEPCGLNQMYSMRYGTIPVVRNTGGLADSVQHFDPASGSGTGCVFNDYDVPAVNWAVNTVLDWFGNAALWQQLMQNAMAKDFSWKTQIPRYEALYHGLAGLNP
jgi:starch synthase